MNLQLRPKRKTSRPKNGNAHLYPNLKPFPPGVSGHPGRLGIPQFSTLVEEALNKSPGKSDLDWLKKKHPQLKNKKIAEVEAYLLHSMAMHGNLQAYDRIFGKLAQPVKLDSNQNINLEGSLNGLTDDDLDKRLKDLEKRLNNTPIENTEASSSDGKGTPPVQS